MANTLTNLIPDAYAALNVVSRELTGFIPGVTRDATADAVALNQTVRVAAAPASSAADFTPAMALPSAADQTFTNTTIAISKNRFVPFSWTGEERYAMNQGPGFLNLRQQQIAQALRSLVNEIESDVSAALQVGASRATGTSATTPFGSTVGDSALARKILDDNGAPLTGRSLVIDTSAGAALRTLGQLTKVNEAGDQMTLRDGELNNLHGFSIRESAQVKRPTVGTAASYVIDGTGNTAAGSTTLKLKTGSGTILAGDVLTIGNYKYVVKTALSGALVVIQSPGLMAAVADGDTVTLNATGSRNIAFSSDAIVLATRLPIFPEEGDLAIMQEVITDPRTGLSFMLRAYPGVGMITYRLHAAWGVSVIKPEHVGVLLG